MKEIVLYRNLISFISYSEYKILLYKTVVVKYVYKTQWDNTAFDADKEGIPSL